MNPIQVRAAQKQDIPALMDLIKELARYEKAAHEVSVSEPEMEACGFGPQPCFQCFVAESSDHSIIGLALFFYKYSTWKGKSLFLEDLIVTENWRGKGVGKLLFEALLEKAAKENVARLDWQVLDWNEPAIQFYQRFDAQMDPTWINGRLSREQIQSLYAKQLL